MAQKEIILICFIFELPRSLLFRKDAKTSPRKLNLVLLVMQRNFLEVSCISAFSYLPSDSLDELSLMVCLVLEILNDTLEDEYIGEETLAKLNTLTQQRKKNTLSFQTRAGGGKINRGDIETSLESFFFQNRLST